MKLKRLISWLLASALAASLAVMPIGAAGTSSFGDISDRETAVNADILRLMGVVSGTGGNQFNPNGTLTRAEFCTMVVKFMQQGDQVPIHATRTIFSDVTSKHWAQGYVNLAASLTVKDGEREVPLAVVCKLADYYKTSVDYLVGRTDEPAPYPPARRR